MTNLQQLINDFCALDIREQKTPGLLEIAGCPNRENVWSNLLAFYLDPGKEHGLGNLLLTTLLETAGYGDAGAVTPAHVEVKREYTTGTGRRIDIVVSSDTFVLGIENKVNAPLYNDLEDYAAAIAQLPGERKRFKIVLSKYPLCNLKGGFVSVAYADLVPAVRKRLEDGAGSADTRYLIFLHDFLNNIENNLNPNIMTKNPELIDFILKNEGEIARLSKFYSKFRVYREHKLYKVCEAINLKELQEKYLTPDRQFVADKGIWVDEDVNNTQVMTCIITFGDIRINMDAYLQHDNKNNMHYYCFFEEKEKYSHFEEELKAKNLWANTRKDFLTSKEEDVASELQNWMDEVLAYLAETNTQH
jgi:hypothetical protein